MLKRYHRNIWTVRESGATPKPVNRKIPILAIAIGVVFCINAMAEEGGPGFLQRETLTGNWGGFRDQLVEKGVELDIEFTEYYQGMLSGSGSEDFEFGGRADALGDLDTEKLGLWCGGGLHTHLTYRFGDLPAFRGGALWPVSTGSVLPLGEKDRVVASSLYLSQRLGDSASFLLGKINALDLLAKDPFSGGWGNHRFMNIALAAPPSGVLPPVIIGAVFNYRITPYTLTFMLYDPNDRTGDYWPDNLLSDGVNLSLGGTWSGEAFSRHSSINLTGIYSTAEKVDLSEIALPPELRTQVKDGAYSVSCAISHLMLESSTHPGQGLGFYGKGAVADGNPNPIEASFSGGFAGHRLVPGRPHDTFGVGYYHYDFSDDLRSAVATTVALENEQGVEVFYNLAATPWFRITADLQWIDPANGENDALVVEADLHEAARRGPAVLAQDLRAFWRRTVRDVGAGRERHAVGEYPHDGREDDAGAVHRACQPGDGQRRDAGEPVGQLHRARVPAEYLTVPSHVPLEEAFVLEVVGRVLYVGEPEPRVVVLGDEHEPAGYVKRARAADDRLDRHVVAVEGAARGQWLGRQEDGRFSVELRVEHRERERGAVETVLAAQAREQLAVQVPHVPVHAPDEGRLFHRLA